MRLILIPVSAIILFFPAFWLFSQVVGDNWGAGIAAFFMYIWYPYMAMKFLGRNDAKAGDDMGSALAAGDLGVDDYEVFAFVKIEDEETGMPFYLLDIGHEKTLCLSGEYLYEAIDSSIFPSSKVKVFWNKSKNFSYGVEASGNKLLPMKTLPGSAKLLDADLLPDDRDILGLPLAQVAARLEESA